MAVQYIESFIFTGIVGTNMIQLTDTGGTSTITLSADKVFTQFLVDLAITVNADPTLNGTYSFSFSLVTGLVTISCDEIFTYVMQGSLNKVLGYSLTAQGGEFSYISDDTVHGFRIVSGLGYDVPQSWDQINFARYRHRRQLAFNYHRGRRTVVDLIDLRSKVEDLLAGPILHGKIRVHHTDSGSAYSLTNLDGFLDVTVQAISDLQTFGFDEDWVTVQLAGLLVEV